MNLIPTIIQDSATQRVLMLGYSTADSLAKTKATGQVWFYSRSKQRLWEKGESSQHYLNVVEIRTDCDSDALLITVRPDGPTCHTGEVSCFGTTRGDVIGELEQVIQQRKQTKPAGSYTAQLLDCTTKSIGNKVTEESIEVVQAARFESKERLAEESADLVYHLLVLLADRGMDWSAVLKELDARSK